MLRLKTNIAMAQLALGSDNRHCNVQRQNTELQLFPRIPSKSSAPPAMSPRKVLEIVPSSFLLHSARQPLRRIRKDHRRHRYFMQKVAAIQKKRGLPADSSTVRRKPPSFYPIGNSLGIPKSPLKAAGGRIQGAAPKGRASPVRPRIRRSEGSAQRGEDMLTKDR